MGSETPLDTIILSLVTVGRLSYLPVPVLGRICVFPSARRILLPPGVIFCIPLTYVYPLPPYQTNTGISVEGSPASSPSQLPLIIMDNEPRKLQLLKESSSVISTELIGVVDEDG